MWVVAGIHRPSAGLQQSFSRVVRFISRENRSTGWQPEADRIRLSKFHPMDSPAAAPIGIHLGISKNVKLPPICAYSLKYNKLPKLRTWGSIPIARSNKTDNLTTTSHRHGCSIWFQLKVLCDLFNENLAVAPNESIEVSRTPPWQR
jgi:hypothetical protein